MDSNDAGQRTLGLITAIATTMHEGGTVDDLRSLMLAVLPGMHLDQESVIDMMATFVSAFGILCRQYEDDCPGADILGLIQKMAVESES